MSTDNGSNGRMDIGDLRSPDKRVERASIRYALSLKYRNNPPRGDRNIKEQTDRYRQSASGTLCLTSRCGSCSTVPD